MKSSRIGVLGGSFNPIHLGHIELAKKAHEQFNLPLVLLMPTSKSYYKDSSAYADSYHRLKMAELAAKECAPGYLEASSLDLDRGGYTYTCDTINELSKDHKEIFFIVGSDSLLYIDKWKDSEDFLKKCIILYGKREGATTGETDRKAKYLRDIFHADVRELNIKDHPISSSDIREMIRNKKSISGLVPKSVEEYIIRNNVYR